MVTGLCCTEAMAGGFPTLARLATTQAAPNNATILLMSRSSS
jgi:hypothetical protein